MVGHTLGQAEAREPADGEIDFRLAHQPTVMNDAEQEARQYQAQRRLGIDTRPPVVRAVQLGDLVVQPGQVEDPIDTSQDVVVGIRSRSEPAKNSNCSGPRRPNMPRLPLDRPRPDRITRHVGFFNCPTGHRCRVALRTFAAACLSSLCIIGEPAHRSCGRKFHLGQVELMRPDHPVQRVPSVR